MSDLLGTEYARLKKMLTEVLSDIRWPTPEAGFIRLITMRENAQPTQSKQRLNEAPILASNGYFYCDGKGAGDPQIDRSWSTALERLLQRDPFPVDRESYFYRPLEALGICVGTKYCPTVAPAIRQQLQNIFAQGVQRIDQNDYWAHPLMSFAAWQIGILWKRDSLPVLETLPIEDLCLLRWLEGQGSFAADVGLQLPPDALDKCILAKCFTELMNAANPAKAAITLEITQQLVDARISADLERTWPEPANARAAVQILAGISRRFHTFASQLTHRHDNRRPLRIKDEYDVQDVLHALLKLHFDDVRPEEWAPSHGGSSKRMDFLLKHEEIVVEAKMTRKTLAQKGVLDELTKDIETYRSHPNCRTLLCLVYDPERRCDNPAALEADLTGPRGPLNVIVHVCPK